MKSPILNEVGTIFIPVKDVEKARDWYCDILGLPVQGEVQFGHIYVLSLKGIDIVLDSKFYSEDNVINMPMFHFNTENIEEAYIYMKDKGVELTTGIEQNHYFNFKDPDGNLLMVCKC